MHALWSAIRAVGHAVDAPVRKPFRDELRVLRHIAAAREDPIVVTALDTLDATATPDIGVEPLGDLAAWFSTSVAPRVASVALVPDQNAGLLSHLASHFLASFTFKRQGLVPGDDVLSVLARAEYYMNEKNLESATRELNQLNGTAKVLLTDWLNAARRRLEVLQALEVRTPTCFTVSCRISIDVHAGCPNTSHARFTASRSRLDTLVRYPKPQWTALDARCHSGSGASMIYELIIISEARKLVCVLSEVYTPGKSCKSWNPFVNSTKHAVSGSRGHPEMICSFDSQDLQTAPVVAFVLTPQALCPGIITLHRRELVVVTVYHKHIGTGILDECVQRRSVMSASECCEPRPRAEGV